MMNNNFANEIYKMHKIATTVSGQNNSEHHPNIKHKIIVRMQYFARFMLFSSLFFMSHEESYYIILN